MKPRILFFIESLNCGGAEKSLISLLPLIDFDRYDVDLMTLRSGGVFERHLPPQVRLLNMPRQNALRGICNAVYSIRWRLNNVRSRPLHNAEVRWSSIGLSMPRLYDQYDVAIAYQQGLPTYYIATKVNAKVKIAWINTHLRDANYRASFNRRYYDKFDHIVAVSDRLADFLLSSDYVNPARVTTIYDILNPGLIHRMSLEYDPADDFKHPGVRLVTVGRMAKAKNYPLAVRTARVLKNRGIDFCWCFVGDGPESDTIRDLIVSEGVQDCVHMTGLRDNPYPLMRACDIYVQTSSFEGFGLTIAEAKILGKPIVSTRFDVVFDQITDGVNGLLADMSPEVIANMILRLVNDKELLSRFTSALSQGTNTTQYTEIQKFNQLLLSQVDSVNGYQ